jgi:predicted nucleotidyltransferase component of viral defense system
MRQGERDPGASIQARLKNHARERGEEMPFVLTRYTIERFLYRLSCSPHAERFVLRGATLFALWHLEEKTLYRPTRDLDVLAMGDSSVEAFRGCMLAILETPVPEDGITFLVDTLHLEERTVGRAYPGLSVSVTAMLGTARPRLEIDIAFGEVVSPTPEMAVLPTLLNQPQPQMKVYHRETVIAEKTQALVELGLSNTRLKDFFDLWYLSQVFSFEGAILRQAIQATFERRGTVFPLDDLPDALTDAFAQIPGRQRQWSGFRARVGGSIAEMSPEDLPALLKTLAGFLGPLLHSHFDRQAYWQAGGPWLPMAEKK